MLTRKLSRFRGVFVCFYQYFLSQTETKDLFFWSRLRSTMKETVSVSSPISRNKCQFGSKICSYVYQFCKEYSISVDQLIFIEFILVQKEGNSVERPCYVERIIVYDCDFSKDSQGHTSAPYNSKCKTSINKITFYFTNFTNFGWEIKS